MGETNDKTFYPRQNPGSLLLPIILWELISQQLNHGIRGLRSWRTTRWTLTIVTCNLGTTLLLPQVTSWPETTTMDMIPWTHIALKDLFFIERKKKKRAKVDVLLCTEIKSWEWNSNSNLGRTSMLSPVLLPFTGKGNVEQCFNMVAPGLEPPATFLKENVANLTENIPALFLCNP